ncbi:Mu transposase C-terminal domain-containing protein [Bosea sp. (in: a-proteobacteria)]|jgi:putative transposase|uniref:Mu transposase C-terminal domain-containing protein n=1 Tax=Bosea sp. (in: a-proteobacteria) TaxID=1871050 RepID=UPI003568613A
MKAWLAARDIAEARLPGLPATRQKASEWLSRAAERAPHLVQSRRGKGGGLEISVDALPVEARAELERRAASSAVALSEARDLVEAKDTDRRQLATTLLRHLSGRQRRVMEARAALLVEIERRALLSGRGRKPVAEALIAELRAGLASAELAALARHANDRAGATRNAAVSLRSIFSWFSAREAGGVAALAPRQSREPEGLPAWLDGFLVHFSQPSKPAITEALDQFARTNPPLLPNVDQVRRALDKLPHMQRAAGREGKLAMRARMAYVARDVSDLLVTSVYVADGKTFDAEIAHPIHGAPFRPELTSVMDVRTRRCVGWSAALDESTHAVVDALRRACGDNGIPAIFYTDRGPGYRNDAMDAALTGFLGRAGITGMRALAYGSQAKGNIERFNHVWSRLSRELPTYLGREMDKEARQLVHKLTRRELATTGRSDTLPAWAFFLDLCEQAVRAYNARPHSELPKLRDPQSGKIRHQTPDEAWHAALHDFQPVLPDAAELEDMFRPWVTRKVRRCLVEWLGNSYFAAELEGHHGEEVILGYDIRDASRVWIRRIDLVEGERRPGALLAVAAFEGHKTRYVPLTYEQAAIERRAAGRVGRLERKIEVVRQELMPTLQLQAAPASLMPIAAAESVVEILPGAPRLSANGRPIFGEDEDLARWLLDHPEAVTDADRAFLADQLNHHGSREVLRLRGFDLDQLRLLSRASDERAA